MEMKTELWNGKEIRFVDIDGEWWAVGNDVTRALEYKDYNKALQRLDGEYKLPRQIVQSGQKRLMTLVSELGAYKLIMNSKLPQAREFEKWVFSVIKELRSKSGLEGFEIFRQMDKEYQKEQMKVLHDNVPKIEQKDYMKVNTITNKAVSNKYGFSKMVKKDEMTPQMLQERQSILDYTTELYSANKKLDLGLNVKETVYTKFK